MGKIDEPVDLSLVKAPILSKSEIADFFGVEESDFECQEQGKSRYKLTVNNGQIGIKMFNSLKHNFVNLLYNQ